MRNSRWVRLLPYVTGSVNQDLLLRNEYLAAENRILRTKLPARLRLSDPERITLAEIGKRLGRRALREVARILRPGGRFFVSVPNLKTLCTLFAHPEVTDQQRQTLMLMMYGAQDDEHDFHYVGLWDGYLAGHLATVGFADIYWVQTFGLFDDTGNWCLGETLISLNLIAVK